MKTQKSQNKTIPKLEAIGFTLIELLVVIAIIGLLASIVLIALNTARVKARDTKRLGDLKQIQSALELYYSDNGGFPSYSGCDSTSTSSCWYTFLPSTYLAKMPVDPLNVSGNYGYYYWVGFKPASSCSWVATNSVNNYMLLTHLENYQSSPNGCSGSIVTSANSNLNYIIGY